MTQQHKHLIVRADIGWCPEEVDLNKISDWIRGLIKKIEMIGNDLKLDNGFGTCGKSGQLVPVGLGIPSCKVLMTVGGSKT